MTRLVTVLLTLAVPDEADAEDAAARAADAAASTALDVVAAFGVEGHPLVPGSVVQHRRGGQPWRVDSVSEHGAVLSNLGRETVHCRSTSCAGPDRDRALDRRGRPVNPARASTSSVSAGSGAGMGKDRGCGPRRDSSRHR